MLKIKLARFGKKNQPHYRIVVNEERSKRDGQYNQALGIYAPTQKPKTLEVNIELYKEWLKKGAQPTPTVASLVKRFESGTPFPEKKARPSKKVQAKLAAEKAATEAAKTAPAKTEAPTEKAAPVEATPTVEPAVTPETPVAETEAAAPEAEEAKAE